MHFFQKIEPIQSVVFKLHKRDVGNFKATIEPIQSVVFKL